MAKRAFQAVCAAVAILTVVIASVGGPPATAADPPAAYEVFTGSVADFYHVPDPLPAGAPGELIRVQTVSTGAATSTVRIMYHSLDGAGRDRAVTGTLSFPNGPAPTGGRPVMSIANGTVGLGPQCAPSRGNGSVFDFGIGGVAVASDYIGEGPVGEVQAYLSRASEGHSVLDAVRAARNYPDAHAGDRFMVLGGSQGGHGALSASELATSYTPELHLLGTVALAPAAVFDKTYGPLDEIVTTVVTAMGVVGLATEHPEIDLGDYAGPAGLAAFDQMRTQCTGDIIPTVLGVAGGIFTHDPRVTEPARSIMLANDVGNVASPSPVLLVQGTADTTVDPRRTDDLFTRMCNVGQTTGYVTVPGATHDDVTQRYLTEIEAWLSARLEGLPAATSCSDAPPDSSSPPTSAPSTTTSMTPAPTVATAVPTSTGSETTLTGISASAGTGADRNGGGPSPTHANELAKTGSTAGTLGATALLGIVVGTVLIASERRRISSR